MSEAPLEKNLPRKLEITLHDYQVQRKKEDTGFVDDELDLPQKIAQAVVQILTEEEFEETPEWRGAGDIYEGTNVVGDSTGAPLKTKNYNYGAYLEYFPVKNQVKIHLFQQKR